MSTNPSNLILFGHKSCGKTYFGRLLTQELGHMFIDTDSSIEKLYEKEFHEQLNYRQIAIKIGQASFRMLERRIIDSLELTTLTTIAVGGGTVLNPENLSKLKMCGRLVYLEVNKEIIKQRIFLNGVPIFLDPHDPINSFEKMYDERNLIYNKISRFKVSIHGKTDQQVLTELKNIAVIHDH
ncbi:MAG: shikimate kinase [Chlamydiales bacterium]|nr:shikimate kinase [Chlamydiales bacterium]